MKKKSKKIEKLICTNYNSVFIVTSNSDKILTGGKKEDGEEGGDNEGIKLFGCGYAFTERDVNFGFYNE